MVELKMKIKKIIKIMIINFPGAKESGILRQIKMYVRRVCCLIFLECILYQDCCQYGQFYFKDICIFSLLRVVCSKAWI